MFSFMGFGELSIMPKVDKPIKQIRLDNAETNGIIIKGA